MRKLPIALLSASVAVALLHGAREALADGFPATAVIEAIKSEINRARQARTPEDEGLIISSVDVVMTAVAKYKAGGDLVLEVPIVKELVGKVTGDVELANTQKISLALEPAGGPIQVSGSENLGLVPAIESARAALRTARRGPIRFDLKEFVFEAEFVVGKSAEGGVRFLFLKADAAYENVAVQQIAVRMTALP